MTDNASEIDVTARSTIGKTTASNQISSRAKKLGQLVEKGLSGLGENQIKGFLNNALLEIEGSLSDFEKDYDAEIKRFENLLKSRKSTVTKALAAGLVKVQYGKGQDFYAVDYAQMYNAFFEKVLKIVKATKSQGSSAILGQIQEHIHEMIGNDSLTDDDKALMNKLIQEMQALQKERAKIKVVEVGKPPEQKVTVEVKQEIKGATPEEIKAIVDEKKAEGVSANPTIEGEALKNAEKIKELEANVTRLNKAFEDAAERSNALFDAVKNNLATQSELDAAESETNLAEEKLGRAIKALEEEEQAQKKGKIKTKFDTRSAKDVMNEILNASPKNKDEETKNTSTNANNPPPPPPRKRASGSSRPPSKSSSGVMSDGDADYVSRNREKIRVLDDAYDQFLGMQSMWMSGIEQSITDMLDGVRLASQEMVFVITAEIQKNIGGKLKTIGKQIEESFGAKSTSGVASIAGKLDTINTTLLEIKNGLIRQKYMQDVKSVPKSIEDEAPQKAIAEMIGNALNQELAPVLGEVLGETSEYNWQKWLTHEGDVRKPFIDKFIGLNKGGIVPGAGNADSVPALLTPGEWVINPRRLAGGTDWVNPDLKRVRDESMVRLLSLRETAQARERELDAAARNKFVRAALKASDFAGPPSLEPQDVEEWKEYQKCAKQNLLKVLEENADLYPRALLEASVEAHSAVSSLLNAFSETAGELCIPSYIVRNWGKQFENEALLGFVGAADTISDTYGRFSEARFYATGGGIKNPPPFFSGDYADIKTEDYVPNFFVDREHPAVAKNAPLSLVTKHIIPNLTSLFLQSVLDSTPGTEGWPGAGSWSSAFQENVWLEDLSARIRTNPDYRPGLPWLSPIEQKSSDGIHYNTIPEYNAGYLGHRRYNNPSHEHVPLFADGKAYNNIDALETRGTFAPDVFDPERFKSYAKENIGEFRWPYALDIGSALTRAIGESIGIGAGLISPDEFLNTLRDLDPRFLETEKNLRKMGKTLDFEKPGVYLREKLRSGKPLGDAGQFVIDFFNKFIEHSGSLANTDFLKGMVLSRGLGRVSKKMFGPEFPLDKYIKDQYIPPDPAHQFASFVPNVSDFFSAIQKRGDEAAMLKIVVDDFLAKRMGWISNHEAEVILPQNLGWRILKGVGKSVYEAVPWLGTKEDAQIANLWDAIGMPRKLVAGTFDFAYEADAVLKSASMARKYKNEYAYLSSLPSDRSIALVKDLLLQPMDKVIAYDTSSNIAGAIGSFNRPTLTDSVLPIRGADRGSGWNMYVGELAALERGKGLGPTLIGMALAKALKGPVGDLLTHIELKAIPFKDTVASYLKMGFIPVGEQNPLEPLIPMAANIKDFLSSPKVSPDVRLALPKKGIMSREHPALKDFSLTAFPYEVIDPVTAAGTVVPAGTRTPNIFKYLASGGPLMPGQTAVVGEEGPEMLVPAGRGFHVLNNKIFRAMGGMRFLKKGTVKADQEPDLDWQGMKWSPDYVTDMSEGLAFVTGNALKEAIRTEVGPEFRTAAGGFTKSLKGSLRDIVTGRSINAPETPIDPVKQMKLDTGKLGMQFDRLISSTRYAVTGGLIFAHVLRILTATSQVYQKSMGAVGRGWGYMLDMIIRPLLPAFLLITRGFIWLGNFFKGHKLIALGTGLALVGVAVFAALYSIYKMKKDVEAAAAAFEKLTAALNGTPYTPPEQGPGILSRIWGRSKRASMAIFGPFGDSPSGLEGVRVNRPAGEEEEDGAIPQPSGQRIIKYKAALGMRIPGYGGGDSVPVLTEPGELIVPKEVVRRFEHRAEGGVAGAGGDFGSWMGGIVGGAGDIFKGGITTIAQGVGSFLSSDIGKSIVGGLGVASKMIGAVMAPIAGVGIAIGAIKGGMHGLGRIFVKGQQAQIETAIAVGKAQRNLLSMISLEGMGILAVVLGIAAILDKYLKGEEIPTIGFAGGLNIWDLITGAAKSIWDFIKTPPKSVWEFLKGVAKSVWEFIKGELKSLWDFVKPVLKSVWEFVKPVFKSVWEFVKGGLKSIWEFVKPVLKPIWDYVKAGVKDVWDFIKTPVKSIWDFITGGKTNEPKPTPEGTGGKTNEPKPTPEGTGWKSAGIKGGVITSALVAIDEVINKKRPLGEALPDIATGGLIGVAAGAITAATGGLTGGPLAALGHDWSIGFGSRTGGTIADALGLDKEGKKIAEDIGGMGMSVVNDSLGWAATGAMVGGVVAGPPGAVVGAGAGAIAGPVIGMFQDLFKIKEEVDKLTSGVNLTPEQANAGGHLTNQYGLIGSAVATAYNVGVDLQGLPAAAAGAVTGGIDAGAKAVESALKTAGELLTTAVDTVKGVVDGVLNTVKEWQESAAAAGDTVREAILGAFASLGEYLAGLPSAIMEIIDRYLSGLPGIGGLFNSAKGALNIPSMASGGDILSDGVVNVHSGEAIIPARVNTNSNVRTDTTKTTITNHNTFVVQREDDRILFEKFKQMMVADSRRLVI